MPKNARKSNRKRNEKRRAEYSKRNSETEKNVQDSVVPEVEHLTVSHCSLQAQLSQHGINLNSVLEDEWDINVLDYVASLLKVQFGLLHGLHKPSVLYLESMKFVPSFSYQSPPDVNVSVNIHFVQSHFVVSCQKEGGVYVYDYVFNQERVRNLASQLRICYSTFSTPEDVKYIVPYDQGRTLDCGPLAACTAYLLLCNQDPQSVRFRQETLRRYVSSCLNLGHFFVPPISIFLCETEGQDTWVQMYVADQTQRKSAKILQQNVDRAVLTPAQKIRVQNRERKQNQRKRRSENEIEINRQKDAFKRKRARQALSSSQRNSSRDLNTSARRKQRDSLPQETKKVIKDADTSARRTARGNLTKETKKTLKDANTCSRRKARENIPEETKKVIKDTDTTARRTARGNLTKETQKTLKDANTCARRKARENIPEETKKVIKDTYTTARRTARGNLTKETQKTLKDANTCARRKARENIPEETKKVIKDTDTTARRTARDNLPQASKKVIKDADTKSRSNVRRIQSEARDKLVQNFRQNPSITHPAYEECLSNFMCEIACGPTFTCRSCNRMLYRTSVKQDRNKSAKRDNLYICNTCDNTVKKGAIPAQATKNHLQLDAIPDELNVLGRLETQLICKILPFMKIVQLPRGAQQGLHGQVVLVPSNVTQTACMLPRQYSDSQIIALNLKRRLKDSSSVAKQYISPNNVNAALSFLIQHNPFYSDVITNKEWRFICEEENPRFWNAVSKQGQCSTNPCENNKSDNESITDSEDEVDAENNPHIRMELDLRKSINTSTCLYPIEGPGVASNEVLNIAPAEGQKPTHVFYEDNWEAKAFPHLFPYGRNTFSTDRSTKITAKKYINQRLLSADPRFAECTEYIFQCLHWSETLDVKSSINIQMRKSRLADLNAGKLKNPELVNNLMKNDELFGSFKKIRGSPQYWRDMRLDMLAKIRQFGVYTFFITGSAADFYWPELIMIVAKQYGVEITEDAVKEMSWQDRRNWLARNPVTAARHIDYIFSKLWKTVILSNLHPIGQILNYDIRKEYQSRGTAHFHSAVHVQDAPKLDENTDIEVVAFIEKHITCQLPEDHDTLFDLVTSRQRHHHTKTCKKKKTLNCRFNFPKPPSSQTLIARNDEEKDKKVLQNRIATVITELENGYKGSYEELLKKVGLSEEQYNEAISVCSKDVSVVLRREPSESYINPYNKYILLALRANMDIQFITNPWACIAYICSYMCKPEKQMSELMRNAVKEAETSREKLKAIGNTFLKSREISEHEAIARLIGIPLRCSNVSVEFLNTAYKNERTRMLKPRSQLDRMDDDDDNIFFTNVFDRYQARPQCLDHLTLAEFVSEYRISNSKFTSESVPNDNLLQDQSDDDESAADKKVYDLMYDLGKIQRRQNPVVLRFHNISKEKDIERYSFRLLLMYLPWRSEDELHLGGSHELKLKHVYDEIKTKLNRFEPYCGEVDEAWKVLEDFDAFGEDFFDEILPPAVELAKETELQDPDFDLLNPEILDCSQVECNDPLLKETTRQQYSLTQKQNIVKDDQYYDMLRSLNTEQRFLHTFVSSWCNEVKMAKVSQCAEPDAFYVFLSGAGGVGKSHLIHAIYQTAFRMLRCIGSDIEKPSIILTASTGKAAVNIGGTTLHTAFNLCCRKRGEPADYKKLSPQSANTLRSRYALLKIVVVDEISMIGAGLFEHFNLRLQDIFENELPFGGVSILAVGDLLQLNPVGDTPIYRPLRLNRLQSLAPNTWNNLFYLHELTTIVRQRKDPEFAQLLCRVRVGEHTEEDNNILKSLENNYKVNDDSVRVFLTNEEVNIFNEKKLSSLPPPIYEISAKDSTKDQHTGRVLITVQSQNPNETGGLRDKIKVAVGARYMQTKNTDIDDGLVNGVTGTITHVQLDPSNLLAGTIYVKFDSVHVGKRALSQSRYPGSVPIRAVTESFPLPNKAKAVYVERTQYPGTLAWAITVHKSQGSTYDSMIGELSTNLKPGQMYTLLSRVTTRAGLRLSGYDPKKVLVNKSALFEMNRLRAERLFTHKEPYQDLLPESVHLIGMLNIRSLSAHYKDIHTFSAMNNCDIICLTETRTARADEYLVLPFVQSSDFGHGIAIFSLKPSRTVFKYDNVVEGIGVIIEDLLVVGIYIKPSTSWKIVRMHLTNVKSLCEEAITKNNCEHCVVAGDFNYTSYSSCDPLTTFFKEIGLDQKVETSTHQRGGVLDLIFTSFKSVKVASQNVYFSDHFLLTMAVYSENSSHV